MSTLFTLSIFVLMGVAVWFGAELYERRKYKGQLYEVQHRMRSAEVKATGFREQCLRLNKDLEGLKKELETERTLKQSAVSGFQHTFRKGVLYCGVSCLALGLIVGGGFSALWTNSVIQAKTQHRIMELDVIARVANMNAGYFKNELEKLTAQYDQLRTFLDEERIAKTVALTKLEIVLDNLSADKWGKGFSLDPKKLLRDWEKPDQPETVSTSRTSLTPTVAF